MPTPAQLRQKALNGASSASGEKPARRTVVSVEKVVPDTDAPAADQPLVTQEVAALPGETSEPEVLATVVEEATSTASEVSSISRAETVRAPKPRPASKSSTAPGPNQSFLGGAVDLATLLSQAAAAGDDEDAEEGEKVTIYLEPSQSDRLREIKDDLKEEVGDLPRLQQEIFRYLLDTVDPEVFTGFAEYVRTRQLQRLVQVEQRRLTKMVRQAQKRHHKITQGAGTGKK